jgi:RNA polymerase sigma-70 factor (ECF subfamily)
VATDARDSHPEPVSIDSETLFNVYARFVASFLYRQGARGADIEDLVQDVFLTAHRKGGYRAGAASPTTFLAHLALEANLKRRRGESRWQRSHSHEASGATVGSGPSSPTETMAARESARRLQAALEAMEPGHRAVFILFELEGEPCDSIAAGLRLPVGTVYSRLHAARRAFRESVTRSERRDDGAPGRGMAEGYQRVPPDLNSRSTRAAPAFRAKESA